MERPGSKLKSYKIRPKDARLGRGLSGELLSLSRRSIRCSWSRRSMRVTILSPTRSRRTTTSKETWPVAGIVCERMRPSERMAHVFGHHVANFPTTARSWIERHYACLEWQANLWEGQRCLLDSYNVVMLRTAVSNDNIWELVPLFRSRKKVCLNIDIHVFTYVHMWPSHVQVLIAEDVWHNKIYVIRYHTHDMTHMLLYHEQLLR